MIWYCIVGYRNVFKLYCPVPEFIDAISRKSTKCSFLIIENEGFGLFVLKTGSAHFATGKGVRGSSAVMLLYHPGGLGRGGAVW